MERKRIEWNREELYRRVWETPTTQLAKEYGVSDVMLAKICRKLKVPKPTLGYWRRKECGYKVTQPALPPMPNQPRIISEVSQEADPPRAPLPPELQAIVTEEERPERQIKVQPALLELHRLTRKTRAALRTGKLNEQGVVVPRTRGPFEVHVTPVKHGQMAIRIPGSKPISWRLIPEP